MHARFTFSFGLTTLAGLTAATEGGFIRIVGKAAAAAEIVIASLRNLRRERSIFFIMFKDYILK
jgi:hypothetical protein